MATKRAKMDPFCESCSTFNTCRDKHKHNFSHKARVHIQVEHKLQLDGILWSQLVNDLVNVVVPNYFTGMGILAFLFIILSIYIYRPFCTTIKQLFPYLSTELQCNMWVPIPGHSGFHPTELVEMWWKVGLQEESIAFLWGYHHNGKKAIHACMYIVETVKCMIISVSVSNWL